VLAPGEIVTEVRLPAPPEGSSYQRLGERAAFSFPLVAVAAARHAGAVSVVAAGVANVPVRLDPTEPLRDLPGHPQSSWKRRVVSTLVDRALAEVG
jgi:CO/xanthine dehydrogenase FAD-binding subunit